MIDDPKYDPVENFRDAMRYVEWDCNLTWDELSYWMIKRYGNSNDLGVLIGLWLELGWISRIELHNVDYVLSGLGRAVCVGDV